MRGQARGSPVLVQRAVSEDPRWTRAVEDPLARPQGRGKDARSKGQLGRSRVSVKGKVNQCPSASARSSLSGVRV
jgi:hypothetical protein